MKTRLALTLMAALMLSACGTPAVSTTPPAEASPSPIPATTVLMVTAQVGTAQSGDGTSQPEGATPLPIPTSAPSTLIPTLASGESPIELKYKLLSQFPDLFFCDPDYYPVARGDEADRARQWFTGLKATLGGASAAGFQAILKHLGLSGLAAFSDEQILLIYREHKKLDAIQFDLAGNTGAGTADAVPADAVSAYQFQLQTEDQNKQGFVIQGQIDGNGVITVQQREPSLATCPICLAAHTRIDTPQGPVRVEDLRPGDVVWSVDGAGGRVPEVILKTRRTPVPANHRMAHVVVEDGQRTGQISELWASPGHPTSDGRRLGDLKVGDRLDGRRVMRIELEPYGQPATYDLLPAGVTGFYWANGILMGSTLGNP
jgi:hypothetical protein